MSLLWLVHSVVQAEQLGTIEPSARLPLSSEADLSVIVTQKIENEASRRLELPREDISVEYLGLGNYRKCNDSSYVSVRIPQSEDFRGPVLVFVEAEKDGRVCGQWNLRVKMEIWQEINVASGAFQVGEEITTVKKRMRRDQLRFNAATDFDNKIARAPINSGEIILASQIREKPDQYRGTQVSVIYKKGNLEIKTDGRLMMDAMIGDDVKVSSQATNSVLHGILKADGNVYIEGRK